MTPAPFVDQRVDAWLHCSTCDSWYLADQPHGCTTGFLSVLALHRWSARGVVGARNRRAEAMAHVSDRETAIELHELYGVPKAEVARLLDRSLSTVCGWLDPERLTKQRKRRTRYQGACEECGAPTDGSNGRAKAPKVCHRCIDTTIWTQAAVVDAIQTFAARYGHAPRAPDFNPQFSRSQGHHQRADRFYSDGDYPVVTSVLNAFDSWNTAIAAAGFTPLKQGQYDRNEVRS